MTTVQIFALYLGSVTTAWNVLELSVCLTAESARVRPTSKRQPHGRSSSRLHHCLITAYPEIFEANFVSARSYKVLVRNNLTQVLLIFFCLQGNAETVPQFQVLILYIRNKTHSLEAPNHFSIIKLTNKQKIKIQRLLSQTSVSISSEVFISTLHLSEGQVSKAWEPSRKFMLFLSLK